MRKLIYSAAIAAILAIGNYPAQANPSRAPDAEALITQTMIEQFREMLEVPSHPDVRESAKSAAAEHHQRGH